MAAYMGHLQVVLALVQAGADLNARDNVPHACAARDRRVPYQGCTALDHAVQSDKHDVAAALVRELLCCSGGAALTASALTRSQRAAMSASTWLPLLVGVNGAASSTLGAFSRHALYTRDVLRAVMRLSK
jgi:hypothetical protein